MLRIVRHAVAPPSASACETTSTSWKDASARRACQRRVAGGDSARKASTAPCAPGPSSTSTSSMPRSWSAPGSTPKSVAAAALPCVIRRRATSTSSIGPEVSRAAAAIIRSRKASWIAPTISRASHGLTKNRWIAPLLMASMAIARSGRPVSMKRAVSGKRSRTADSNAVPDMPGMCWSVIRTSTPPHACMSDIASYAPGATRTSNGWPCSARCKPARSRTSSSTRRTTPEWLGSFIGYAPSSRPGRGSARRVAAPRSCPPGRTPRRGRCAAGSTLDFSSSDASDFATWIKVRALHCWLTQRRGAW